MQESLKNHVKLFDKTLTGPFQMQYITYTHSKYAVLVADHSHAYRIWEKAGIENIEILRGNKTKW